MAFYEDQQAPHIIYNDIYHKGYSTGIWAAWHASIGLGAHTGSRMLEKTFILLFNVFYGKS